MQLRRDTLARLDAAADTTDVDDVDRITVLAMRDELGTELALRCHR